MRIFFAVLLIVLSPICLATSSWQGKVVELRASNVTHAILFRLSGTLEGAASCNEWNLYAIDLRHPGGEQVFELVKFAFLHDLRLEAKGLGTCRTHWKSEGVKEVYLKKDRR